jgi:hypothetical protein
MALPIPELRKRKDPRIGVLVRIPIDVLNAELSSEMPTGPISGLLRLLQQLEEIRRSVGDGKPLPRNNALSSKVNRILALYKWSPGVRTGSSEFYEFPQFSTDPKRHVAQVSIWQLLGKLLSGDILRFRQCSDCHLWFYAKTEHQRFCTDACRKRYASKSSEYKTKRKVYMRSYRQMEKQRDRQAKAQMDSKRR